MYGHWSLFAEPGVCVMSMFPRLVASALCCLRSRSRFPNVSYAVSIRVPTFYPQSLWIGEPGIQNSVCLALAAFSQDCSKHQCSVVSQGTNRSSDCSLKTQAWDYCLLMAVLGPCILISQTPHGARALTATSCRGPVGFRGRPLFTLVPGGSAVRPVCI